MKQIDKMSRLTGELEKCFRLLNQDFFNGELPTPIITVIPTPRAYAHYVPYDIWNTKESQKREINIASGTLDRPLENILASLLHEMVHFYDDVILNIQDVSRKGQYHNKHFAQQAEQRGLIVTRSDKYGWAHTAPADRLLEWILNHNELREVEMCRANPTFAAVGIGTHASNGGELRPITTTSNSHHRTYRCPCCGNSVRATKQVNIICGDCMERMILK